MITSLLGFTLVAAVLTVSPGPDFAVVLRTAVGSGRRAALWSAVGISTGCFLWGSAGAAGLTALLSASRPLYDALRIAGALYLVWLGVRALRGARRATAPLAASPVEAPARAPLLSPPAAFRTGLLTNVLNPKVGVVYMSLLPQFIPDGAPVAATTMLLVTVHAALSILWLGTIALAVHRARALLWRPRVRRRIDQATGCALLALGAAVGVETAR